MPETLRDCVERGTRKLIGEYEGNTDKIAIASGGASCITAELPLDATVYRSCPECGGSRKCQRCDGEGKWFYELELAMIDCDDCKGTGTCPACADAPVAIVSAALREKARDAGINSTCGSEHEYDPAYGLSMADWDKATDAILSTVLGHVRYAKAWRGIGRLRLGFQEDTPMLDVGDGTARELDGDEHIAILEEAGKEGDK